MGYILQRVVKYKDARILKASLHIELILYIKMLNLVIKYLLTLHVLISIIMFLHIKSVEETGICSYPNTYSFFFAS